VSLLLELYDQHASHPIFRDRADGETESLSYGLEVRYAECWVFEGDSEEIEGHDGVEDRARGDEKAR